MAKKKTKKAPAKPKKTAADVAQPPKVVSAASPPDLPSPPEPGERRLISNHHEAGCCEFIYDGFGEVTWEYRVNGQVRGHGTVKKAESMAATLAQVEEGLKAARLAAHPAEE